MVDEADQELWQKPTSSDDPVLALVKEGRVDAEIAVRLGISNAEVKERIGRLVAKHGVKNRAELREPPKPEVAEELVPMEFESVEREKVSPVRAAVWAGVIALAVGLGAGWWIRDEQVNQEPSTDRNAAFDSEFYSRSLREMIPFEPTPTPRAAFGKQADLGIIFTVANVGQAVSGTSVDNSKTVITLAGPATFPIDGDSRWETVEQSSSRWAVSIEVQGQTVTVWLESGTEATWFARGENDALKVSTKDGSPPVVKLWVAKAPWRFDLSGHLFVVPLLVD